MASTDLVAVAILEEDSRGDVLCVWSYPSLDAASEAVLLSRGFPTPAPILPSSSGSGAPPSTSLASAPTSSWVARYRSLWQYFHRDSQAAAAEPGVKSVCIALLSPVYNPERFAALLPPLLSSYISSGGDASVLLEKYLGAFATGRMAGWRRDEFPNNQALLAGGSLIKDVVEPFGLQAVIIWTAVLLKKRVVVVGEDTSIQRFLRAVPRLAWARQNWSILRPQVTLGSELEMEDLSAAGVYVAGFTDMAARSLIDQPQFCDVLVDLAARQVTVAESAKDDFRMGEMHKGVAAFMLQTVESYSTASVKSIPGAAADNDMIKGIFQRTTKIIDLVKAVVAQDPACSAAALDAHKVPRSTHRFMYNLAVAEGLVNR